MSTKYLLALCHKLAISSFLSEEYHLILNCKLLPSYSEMKAGIPKDEESSTATAKKRSPPPSMVLHCQLEVGQSNCRASIKSACLSIYKITYDLGVCQEEAVCHLILYELLVSLKQEKHLLALFLTSPLQAGHDFCLPTMKAVTTICSRK